MITVVEGRPGQGKSIYLVHKIVEFLKQGHDVYTNVTLTGAIPNRFRDQLHNIEKLDDLLDVRRGKVVLDEVQLYFNSRQWDKLDIKFQYFLQQHRKRGIDILGATQSIKRVDVVFRQLVHIYKRVTKVVSFTIPRTKHSMGFFYLREFDPDSVESQGQKDTIGYPQVFFADPYIMSIYETTQEYVVPKREGKRVVEEYVYVNELVEKKQLVSTVNA